MWTAKISIDGSKLLVGNLTLKHKINFFGFPLSYYYEKGFVIVNITGVLLGENKNKVNFVKDLRKSSRIINLEINEDFFIATIKDPIHSKDFYNKSIIHLAPALIDENGKETINIGCFDKRDLGKAIETIEKHYNAKIHFIQEKKIKNISVIKQNPELTDKQKHAMALAIKHGYYEYPRKISIEELAKVSKHSFSTFHAHLRKAEHKLLPFYFN